MEILEINCEQTKIKSLHPQIRAKISALQKIPLDSVEDNLLQYSLLLIENGNPKSKVKTDLSSFFDNNTSEDFVDWLWTLLEPLSSNSDKIAKKTFTEENPSQNDKKSPSPTEKLIIQRKRKFQPAAISTSTDDNSNLSSAKPSFVTASNKPKYVKYASDKETPRAINGRNAPFINTANNFLHPRPQPMRRTKQIIKCKFWPNCRNQKYCQYFHPTQVCVYYPNCAKGDACLYLHLAQQCDGKYQSVRCKFGSFCKRKGCRYDHTVSGDGAKMEFNKFGIRDDKSVCAFDKKCEDIKCGKVHPEKDKEVQELKRRDERGEINGDGGKRDGGGENGKLIN